MTRMTDERLAGIERTYESAVVHELIAALKAERAKVRELEQEVEKTRLPD